MAEHANTFHLVVASVGETRFDGAALSVTLPGTSGEMTLLPHHEPLVTTLKPGTITVKDSLGEIKKFEIEGGVIECSGNKVVVLL
ncbi:MAG: atpC [Candidatus Kaiserbacteria bacterium]|nr:atpC [Candidatus Kaiserbacteria bacterium]